MPQYPETHQAMKETVPSNVRAPIVVENPATSEVLAEVPSVDAAGVDSVVQRAHAEFFSWRARPARERGEYLRLIARKIRDEADELAELESSEVGKPVSQARKFDIEFCISVFEMFANFTSNMPGRTSKSGPVIDFTRLYPFGVVAGIIPFNWPPIHTAGKLAPALAVGNAVVVKPPEQAPLTIMRIVDIVRSVLPDDVVHVIPGGGDTGSALVSHPLVRKISFTGSPITGASVIKSAADQLTPTLMELGGKNPLIVFADADLDLAVSAAVDGAYFNQGEACTAASRLLVEASVHDEFVDRVAKAVLRLRVGDGANPNTDVGPVVDATQKRRVTDYIKIGLDEGAQVVAQSPLPDDPRLEQGHFVAPTLFAGVSPDMRIAREEIFGPVTAVIPFSSEEEAIEIANDTEFGLVAGVFTRDNTRALRVSDAIEAGIVFVNNYFRSFVGVPFGGTKKSGYGREHAVETLSEFGYTKTVRLPSGDGDIPQWDGAVEATS
ncbi:aldehyde dehydrogenase family protein [Brevibacterium sp. FAM 24638]|uniref:aldehyde dehydrogenase family protein n=1 Tax=Brevibacterium sp. FAM 24638 TaxID=3415681 RepID=UPI003C7D66B7